ncbi:MULTISPECIES: aspartyl/asparaginyl beta-hydroxylase domain-containing protein [Roseivirga]|uniref:aspartyl/asparaginyl beta-hydroxylase domain-containing protein n=1 Tax=Roseivirga TaxID=290180 RepID=UPI00257CF6BE|nr:MULTISPECIES: aspartyl/asparaginyl beta-hydroxylase domain-containing protein [Roseivirga]|tara:strand:- start:22422 stop:23198 length:777 start_codon:yes stop_codon:yes gene_type:complete
MLVLEIIGVVIVAFIVLNVILYFVEPSLIAITFSLVLRLFYRNPPMVDLEKHFKDHQLLKDNWKVIQAELLEILRNEQNIPKFHEVDKIQRFINDGDKSPWRVFMFKAYDNWQESNCAKAPKTTELLKQIPGITTAMFSILGPQKHIPPHNGFYKGVYRYHLGLIIPKEGECYIVNGGQRYDWKEGEDVLFDDTFKHAVWNKTDETRVVLFCDVFRTDLPKIFQPMNRWVYGLREKSQRLKKVLKNAEVQVDLKPQAG